MSKVVWIQNAITLSYNSLRLFTTKRSAVPSSHIFTFQRCLVHVRTMNKITPKTVQLDSPEFESLFTPELNSLTEVFKKHNYELRIAGGAVRDLLMGKAPHDIDLATTATPTEMKAMFTMEGIRMFNNNGEKHGTISARMNDKDNFECTTLRIDVRTDGRHAEVEWTKDWQLDALRRDLTVNSLFLGMDGTVYDYFNGIEDIKHKRIRFVGSAPDRIQEDYLRILRYFRFFGRMVDDPDSHEEETLTGIKQNMDGMIRITGERIWMEFKRILTGRHAESIIPVMIQCGMAPYIGLPEETNTDHYTMVCRNTEGLEPQATTRLAALLTTPGEMYDLNTRLKLSKEEFRNAMFIIERRDDHRGPDVLRYCEDLHCDSVGREPRTRQRIEQLLKYSGDTETLAQFKDWVPRRFPVNGKHLMDMGVLKGPAIARTLMELRQRWKLSNYSATEDELLDMVEEIMSVQKERKEIRKQEGKEKRKAERQKSP